MLIDAAYAASDDGDAGVDVYDAADDTAAAAAATREPDAGSHVESSSRISEYVLLALCILRKVYHPSREEACADAGAHLSRGNDSLSSSPLLGVSAAGNHVQFKGGGHAAIGIISATFPSFWTNFIRDPSSPLSPPPPAPVPLLSAYISSLGAHFAPALMAALLVAVQHHAHVGQYDD